MKILILLLTYTLFTQSLMAEGDYIELYSSYTNGERIIVEGRVIDQDDKKSKSSKAFSAFFNDERKNLPITLTLNSKEYLSRSDDEGYFNFDIKVKKPLQEGVAVSLSTEDKQSLIQSVPFFPSPIEHIGIISDVDDTIVVSDVTNKIKLFYNIFFKNYKERQIVKEVKEKIQTIIANNHLAKTNALFFISGSPYQLTNTINNFLDLHQLPKRTLLTKKIHGEKSDKLLATIGYKYNKIVRLFEMYPQVTWVFFGDSGEKDEAIYRKVQKEFPLKVKAIYIRDVESKEVKEITLLPSTHAQQ